MMFGFMMGFETDRGPGQPGPEGAHLSKLEAHFSARRLSGFCRPAKDLVSIVYLQSSSSEDVWLDCNWLFRFRVALQHFSVVRS